MTKLKSMIRKCGLKQIEVARRTGMKYKTLNRLCRTGIRTSRKAKFFSEVLRCHPMDLVEF